MKRLLCLVGLHRWSLVYYAEEGCVSTCRLCGTKLYRGRVQMKEWIRRLLWPLSLMNDGEFYAAEGTLLFRFFNWLYEDTQ